MGFAISSFFRTLFVASDGNDTVADGVKFLKGLSVLYQCAEAGLVAGSPNIAAYFAAFEAAQTKPERLASASAGPLCFGGLFFLCFVARFLMQARRMRLIVRRFIRCCRSINAPSAVTLKLSATSLAVMDGKAPTVSLVCRYLFLSFFIG